MKKLRDEVAAKIAARKFYTGSPSKVLANSMLSFDLCTGSRLLEDDVNGEDELFVKFVTNRRKSSGRGTLQHLINKRIALQTSSKQIEQRKIKQQATLNDQKISAKQEPKDGGKVRNKIALDASSKGQSNERRIQISESSKCVNPLLRDKPAAQSDGQKPGGIRSDKVRFKHPYNKATTDGTRKEFHSKMHKSLNAKKVESPNRRQSEPYKLEIPLAQEDVTESIGATEETIIKDLKLGDTCLSQTQVINRSQTPLKESGSLSPTQVVRRRRSSCNRNP